MKDSLSLKSYVRHHHTKQRKRAPASGQSWEGGFPPSPMVLRDLGRSRNRQPRLTPADLLRRLLLQIGTWRPGEPRVASRSPGPELGPVGSWSGALCSALVPPGCLCVDARPRGPVSRDWGTAPGLPSIGHDWKIQRFFQTPEKTKS